MKEKNRERMIILRISLGYNSPFLLLNASLLFLYFAKLTPL